MKIFFSFLSLILFTSCLSPVVYDYERLTDFSFYKEYSIYPDLETGLNELDNKRIIRVIDSLLQQKGLVKSNSPQFLVNFYAEDEIGASGSSIGIGIGGGGGNVGVGVSGGIPIGGNVLIRKITLDFIDSAKDKLFWKATGNGKLGEKSTPDQKEAFYSKIIQRMLKEYPPDA